MFEITDSALVNLKHFLSEQKMDSVVRIAVRSETCAGPGLWLAMDEARENDNVFEHDGVSFVVDKELCVLCGAIKLNFIEENDDGCGCSGVGMFAVTSEKSLPFRSGGCSWSSKIKW